MGLIGFVLAPLYHRVPIVFLPPLLFLKRPVTWLQAITRHKGTIAYAPNFAYALCVKRIKRGELEGLDLSTWRVAGCGAEPIRPETLEAFAAAFAQVGFRKEALLPSYGMAESSLAIAFTELGEGMKTLSVDGPTLWAKGAAELVAEDDENAVRLVSCGPAFPEHTDPRLRARRRHRASSPFPRARSARSASRPERDARLLGGRRAHARGLRRAASCSTGDLGFLHDGHLFICGRSKEVVIVNGRNYYPQDMEWEASKVAGVRKGNVVAFGARDPSGVERDRERVVVAFEVQDAGAARRSRRASCRRGAQGRAGRHGPHARRRRRRCRRARCRRRRAASCSAPRRASSTRPASSMGRPGARDGDELDVASRPR